MNGFEFEIFPTKHHNDLFAFNSREFSLAESKKKKKNEKYYERKRANTANEHQTLNNWNNECEKKIARTEAAREHSRLNFNSVYLNSLINNFPLNGKIGFIVFIILTLLLYLLFVLVVELS